MFLIVAVFASCGGNSNDDTPLIFAAASLSDVLEESAEIFTGETGKQVEFSFGGSIALANQIAKLGAPADGVFFVGEEPKNILSELTEPIPDGSLVMLNSLVIVATDGAQHVGTFVELADSGERVAIGDPELAPAGLFAKQALESAREWDDIEDQLIFAVDVRAAVAAVESGNAEYGIVYRTDAKVSKSVSILSEIYDGYPTIAYVGRTLKDATNSGSASEFFEFLAKSDRVHEVFESAGFTVGFSGS